MNTSVNSRLLWLGLIALMGAVMVSPARGAEGIDPEAERLIRAAGDYLAKLESWSVETNTEMAMSMDGSAGVPSSKGKQKISVRRPRRVRIESNMGTGMSGSWICDGEKVFTYMKVANRYVEEEAPEELGSAAGLPMNIAFALSWSSSFVWPLLGEDPADAMLEGVTEAKVVGKETIHGVEAHRIHCVQEVFAWDIWIADGERPLIHKMTLDFSSFADGTADEQPRMTGTLDFAKWEIALRLPDDHFTFTPPAGAVKADTLFPQMDAMGEEELQHPLVGQQAPMVRLKSLEGKWVSLEDYRDKSVVVLDFWATWCGPCVQGMPVLAKIAKDYAGKDVAVYAVNQGEEPDIIETFLKEKKIDVPVLLDPHGEVGEEFDVQGIPQLVIMDKKGVIQAVHVGYTPGEEELLRSEIDSVLAGKTLVGQYTPPPRETEVPDLQPTGMKLVWSRRGGWCGVAADSSAGAIYAVASGGRAIALDAEGGLQSTFRLKGNARQILAGNLTGDEQPELIGFGTWSREVTALTAAGETLWQYENESGIDDVAMHDLDDDGLDEVIVGHNGDEGICVLESDGRELWRNKSIGNVWHVDAGDVTGDGKPEVVSTSAQGEVHLFDPVRGEAIRDIKTPRYSNQVRVAPDPAGSRSLRIVTNGENTLFGQRLYVLTGTGEVEGSVKVSRANIQSMAAARSRPWIAIGTPEGVEVVDIASKKRRARIERGAMFGCQVAWLEGTEGGAPRMLLADGERLSVFGIEEASASSSQPAVPSQPTR